MNAARFTLRPRGVSRRQFIRTATMVTGGFWLAGCATSNRPRGRELTIIHYTDSHIRSEFDVPLAIEMSLHKAITFHPSFMLMGGDLITDGYSSSPALANERYDISLNALKKFHAPVHYCLGNHDVVAVEPPPGVAKTDDPKALFRERLGLSTTYYSFDQGGWHFIVLDSLQIPNDRGLKYIGFIDAAQLAWLQKDLETTGTETPIVVVTHMPLLTVFYQREKGSTEPAPADRIVVNAREVIQLLSPYNTKLVLQGHLHICERIEYGGITFITGGAVCGKWWRGSYYGHSEGFGVVTLTDDSFRYEYQTYGWAAKRPADR